MATLTLDSEIYLSCWAQLAPLLPKNVFTAIVPKYADFVDIFSPEFSAKFPKYIKIDDYLIDLIDS